MLKTRSILIFFILVSLAFRQAGHFGHSELFQESEIQKPAVAFKEVKNEAFKAGEKLKFLVHYGWIDAGIAELEVKEKIVDFGTRKAFHVVGTGTSKGTFDWFFKVRDKYETYLDEKALIPWYFVRRVDEGGYKINQDYFFNHYDKTVRIEGGQVFQVPENVQDMLSAFYYARILDFSNAKKDDIFTIQCFVDKELWPMKMKYVGKETIKTDLGKFRCLKFRPVVQKGRIFKKEEDMNVWITDDKNHIPIRAEAKILVGSIKMDLISYSNLVNPISKVE